VYRCDGITHWCVPSAPTALKPSNSTSWFVVRLGPIRHESPPSTVTQSNCAAGPTGISPSHGPCSIGPARAVEGCGPACCTRPAKRRSRPSEVVFRPHRSRLMTPPAGPSTARVRRPRRAGPPPPGRCRRAGPSPHRDWHRCCVGSGPPPSPLWCVTCIRVRAWFSTSASRSAPPAPDLTGAAAPGAPTAPSRCQPRPAAGVVSIHPCRTLRTRCDDILQGM
jgi:hypothetical protein